MRVALIGPVPPHLGGATPGGVATHQVHLAAGLNAAGISAPLLATNTCVVPAAWRARGGEAPYPLYHMARLPGAEAKSAQRPRTLGTVKTQAIASATYVAAVGLPRMARYAAYLVLHPLAGSRREVLLNVLWYRRFLAEVRPAVIHVQHPLERCLYTRLVQRLEGWRLPLVVTAHSLFGEHSEADIHALMAPNLRAADRVIAVSPHIAEQAVDLGVDPRRVRVIRSGVDVERFRPADRSAARRKLNIAEPPPLVLFVGNLEPRKQVDVLLRALIEVRAALPEAVLVVVGSGESAGMHDQTARLVQLARDLGLGSGVRFLGRLDDDTLLSYYAAADVFALPSSSEAQGIVALEAMACGLPVVASAVGGLLGTIDDGQTGFLVASGDAHALACRLVRVLQDGALRKQIAAAARRAVEQRFSWTRSVDATLAVYCEVART